MVYVTGYGVVGPGNVDVEEFIRLLENKEHRLQWNQIGSDAHVVGRVEEECLSIPERFKEESKYIKMLLPAVEEAVTSAGLDVEYLKGKRVAIVGGSSSGPAEYTEELVSGSKEGDYSHVMDGSLRNLTYNFAPYISDFLGIEGEFNLLVSNTCTSALDALGIAETLIKSDVADICIVASSEQGLSNTLAHSFERVRSFQFNQPFDTYGKPFQKLKSGFVMAEGSAVVIVESEASVKERQGLPKARLTNVQSNNDGKGSFGVDRSGNRMMEVVKKTVGDRVPTYINSQALGLLVNDRIELKVGRQLFGNEVPMMSVKGNIGHPFGASGLFQLVASVESIVNQKIYPTYGTEGYDFGEANIVTDVVHGDVEDVLITSHGFGGTNTCVLVSKV